MNQQNLHEIINRYEAGLDQTMDSEHFEQLKWVATKCFRDAWFATDAHTRPFSEMFNMARKECGYLVDNSRTSPSNGIVKLAEVAPSEVERLFREVLFAADGGDLALRQQHMEEFDDGIETLRQKYFPKFWKYKQERHAESCYLAFYAPADNFIYRYSDAEMLARHIEFVKPLGSGHHFSLPNYYELCNIVVSALKEHPSLLALHASKLDERCYQDDSLHLMAFDLMYCSRCYGYYAGLVYNAPTSPKGKAAAALAANARETQKEAQERIAALTEQLLSVEAKLAELEPISLIGTRVSTTTYGDGMIIDQSENKVLVQFDGVEKGFVIHRKYSLMPRFEDEDQIVSFLSDRADALAEKDNLAKLIERERRLLDT